MDKYEYKLKAEEIVRLAGKRQYKAAAKIADEIRWEKVRNIQMLCTVSEIYERVGQYEESKDVLILAYNRSPNGKMIIYRLVELCIALKDYQEATAFYHEYVELAPNDSNTLPLKYKLYRGKGAKLETQIAILEEFKSKDYQEEWILELARLYHQAGMKEKCVETCNEIDLWFNKGDAVIKALELKRLYEPLTPLQEQKLSGRSRSVQEQPIVQEQPVMQEQPIVQEEPMYYNPEVQPVMQEQPMYYTPEVQPMMQEQPVMQEQPIVQKEPMYYNPEVQPVMQEQPMYYTPEVQPMMQEQPVMQEQPIVQKEPMYYNPEVQPIMQEQPMYYNMEPQPMVQQPVYNPEPQPVVQQPVYNAEQQPMMQEPLQETTASAQQTGSEEPTLSSVDSVAEAIIRMARPTPKPESELQRGFSILPKGDVVKSDAEAFAFNLPDGVEQVDFTKNSNQQGMPMQAAAVEEETQNVVREEASHAEIQPTKKIVPIHVTELGDSKQENDLELLKDKPVARAEEEEEKPRGLFGKVISRLKMEDDEMDDDFNDDYEDTDDFEDEEDGMVTRGLTGQYEKVVIDDDDDESDPLNTRMTFTRTPKEEEEYEYIYGDEDEDEEYEEIDDLEMYEDEKASNKSGKRFRFFRSMQDDEDEEEYEEYEEEMMEEVIPLSYASKYDTLNLQKELAKSIQQLMDATEKETVDSTLENVKKMVEASNIPELTETMRFKAIRGNMLNSVAKRQAEKLQQAKNIEEVVKDNAANADTEPAEDATVSRADARPKPVAELAIKLKPSNQDKDEPLENILTQEDDGQLSLFMPEEEIVEKQITGQLNIEDVLKEWEKQKILSETDKEKRALEEARKRALEETQGIMTEIMGLLKDVIPKIGSIKDGEEKMSVLAESLERVQKSLPYSQGIVDAAQESKVAASAIEAACAEAVMELEKLEANKKAADVAEATADASAEEVAVPVAETTADTSAEEVADTIDEATADTSAEEVADPIAEATTDTSAEENVPEEVQEAPVQEGGAEYINEQIALHNIYTQSLPHMTDEMLQAAMEAKTAAEVQAAMEAQTAAEVQAAMEAQVQAAMAQAAATQDQGAGIQAGTSEPEEVSAELMPEVQDAYNAAIERAQQVYEEQHASENQQEDLNEEQKDILAYFLAIDSLNPVLKSIVKRTEYAPEHMIITGDAGSGKTSVAMRIIKAAQVNKQEKIETIAKIKAELLNQKEITDILAKVNGGVLIIENAGSLKPTTVYAIEDALYTQRFYVQIILADKKEAIGKLLSTTRSFMNDIQMRVDLPVYTNNELAEFAKTYAEVNGYTFDGMAILALHSVIEFFQTEDHVANLEDMKNIMDEAMESADKRNRKLLGKLFGKKSTNGIVLTESDFE